MNLLSNSRVFNIVIQTTAGSTDLEGVKVMDMAGYEGVMAIGIIDTVTAGGLCEIQAQYSDSTSTTDMVTDTGTSVGSSSTECTTDWDDKLLLCDIYKPTKRYVSFKANKATQVSEIRVIAIQYGNHLGPVVQSTGQYGVADSGVFVSPST